MPAVIQHCEPCNHAHDYGHWGDTLPKGAGTHCRTCHTSWPGTQVWGHCAKCHLTFRGISAFDKHQKVTGCPDTKEDVALLLSRLRVYLMGQGKYYLDIHQHKTLGFTFWAWNL